MRVIYVYSGRRTRHICTGEVSPPKGARTEQTLNTYWFFRFHLPLTFQQVFNSQNIWVCAIAYLIVSITWLDANQDRDKLGEHRVFLKTILSTGVGNHGLVKVSSKMTTSWV